MGFVASKIWTALFGQPYQYKIVILGLNNAGKTTILYKLHLGQVVLTQPTIGSNVEEVKHNNVHFQAWDLGGQEALRPMWATYLLNTHAIVFVVDSGDDENLLVAKMELFNLLLHESLKNAVLLVLANKQDVSNSRDAKKICEDLSLHAIKDHDWHIQGCCALNGEGLTAGMDWLTSKILSKQT